MPLPKALHVVLVVVLGVPVAACTVDTPEPSTTVPSSSAAPVTREITDVAIEIAEADPDIGEFIKEHPYEIEGALPLPDGTIGVTITFVPPVEDGWPPMEVCEVGGIEGPATGLDLQVDVDAGQLVALSPRWGDVSCLGFR